MPSIQFLTLDDLTDVLARLDALEAQSPATLQTQIDGLDSRVTTLEQSGGGGGGALAVKSVAASRDLAAAAGTQDITGFGFTPKAVLIYGAESGTGIISVGSAVNGGNSGMAAQLSGGACHVAGGAVYAGATIASAQQFGTVTFITDGVRIDWSKLGAQTGIFNFYVLGLG